MHTFADLNFNGQVFSALLMVLCILTVLVRYDIDTFADLEVVILLCIFSSFSSGELEQY